jgi:translation initiation factor IF-2
LSSLREVEAAAPAAPTRKELNVVIKGDVSGSVEAVAGALIGIGNNVAGLRIVHTGVGDVTETDVQLAQTAEGTSRVSAHVRGH